MGIFDALKKNKSVNNNSSTDTKIVSDAVTQNVAICMNSMKITKMPTLKFLYDDKGLFEGLLESHINDAEFNMVKSAYGKDMYLMLLGCHALGFGAYVTICQAYFKKPISDWTLTEANKVNSDIRETDPYELALNALGFPLESNNKKCLDHIVEVAGQTYLNATGASWDNKDNLKAFMKVLYNAGITLVMRD